MVEAGFLRAVHPQAHAPLWLVQIRLHQAAAVPRMFSTLVELCKFKTSALPRELGHCPLRLMVLLWWYLDKSFRTTHAPVMLLETLEQDAITEHGNGSHPDRESTILMHASKLFTDRNLTSSPAFRRGSSQIVHDSQSGKARRAGLKNKGDLIGQNQIQA